MHALGVDTFRELHRLSVEDPEAFWPAVVDDLQLQFRDPWRRVLDTSHGVEWPRWFVGARLNIATNCVHRWASSDPDREAVVSITERGERRSTTFAALSNEVRRLAEALQALGVEPGERVRIFLPMSLEAVIAGHACAHIGAVQVPVFSGFAAKAIEERFRDAGVRVVITADETYRRGRKVDLLETLRAALRDLPAVTDVIVPLRSQENPALLREPEVSWAECDAESPGDLLEIDVDAEHPSLIIYTSGTTGRPKGAVHVHGGFLVSIAREAAYQLDVTNADTIHFVSDLGWLMGPWTIVGAGALGARIVVAEGAPDFPPDRLSRLVDEERVSVLGVSPTLVRSPSRHPVQQYELSSLRATATTGEPLGPAEHEWLTNRSGRTSRPVVNMSGGTEIGACFLSTYLGAPIRATSVGFPVLGMDVDVVREDGESVREQLGELVCRRPFPGMTRGFWNDADRYLATYWDRFPGAWTHGDLAFVDADGYWYIRGRSDDTLNIAGKRIGPSEIEAGASQHPDVVESAAIGVPSAAKGQEIWVAYVPRRGGCGPEVEEALKQLVAASAGHAFRPAVALAVEDLPRTRSGKVMRRLVRAAVTGDPYGDTSSLDNPEVLDVVRRQCEHRDELPWRPPTGAGR
jgi:acetyl-CoA synthetase